VCKKKKIKKFFESLIACISGWLKDYSSNVTGFMETVPNRTLKVTK